MKNTAWLGKHLIYEKELLSTNSHLAALAQAQPLPEGTVVFTPHQIQGRGQRGTTWETQLNQNLTFSVVLYPRFLPISHFFYLSKIAAIAVFEAVKAFLPEKEVHIKWANDVLVEKQKIAGILIENQWEGNQLKAVILGIGLNVNQTQFLQKMNTLPTSLALQGGKNYELTEILDEVCFRLEKSYQLLKNQDFKTIDNLYLQHFLGYQNWVKLRIGDEQVEAYIEGVELDGQLKTWINNQQKCFDIKEIQWIL